MMYTQRSSSVFMALYNKAVAPPGPELPPSRISAQLPKGWSCTCWQTHPALVGKSVRLTAFIVIIACIFMCTCLCVHLSLPLPRAGLQKHAFA